MYAHDARQKTRGHLYFLRELSERDSKNLKSGPMSKKGGNMYAFSCLAMLCSNTLVPADCGHENREKMGGDSQTDCGARKKEGPSNRWYEDRMWCLSVSTYLD